MKHKVVVVSLLDSREITVSMFSGHEKQEVEKYVAGLLDGVQAISTALHLTDIRERFSVNVTEHEDESEDVQ